MSGCCWRGESVCADHATMPTDAFSGCGSEEQLRSRSAAQAQVETDDVSWGGGGWNTKSRSNVPRRSRRRVRRRREAFPSGLLERAPRGSSVDGDEFRRRLGQDAEMSGWYMEFGLGGPDSSADRWGRWKAVSEKQQRLGTSEYKKEIRVIGRRRDLVWAWRGARGSTVTGHENFRTARFSRGDGDGTEGTIRYRFRRVSGPRGHDIVFKFKRGRLVDAHARRGRIL